MNVDCTPNSSVAHPRLLPPTQRTTVAPRIPQPSPTRYSFSYSELHQVLYLQREVENVKLEDIQSQATQPNSPDKKPVLKNKDTLASCEICRGQPKAECSEHGPLFISPRKTKPKDIQLSYAISSFPDEVQLCWSSIPGAGYGVSAKQHIPIGTWIGPYEGRRTRPEEVTKEMDTSYMWEIFQDGRLVCYLDASDENTSSWMRFIRCARHRDEQNLYAFQYCGNIYYRAFRNISVGEELLVWYDDKYQQHMGLPLNIQDMAVVDPNGNKLLFDLMACNVKPPVSEQHHHTYTPPVTQSVPVTKHPPTDVVPETPVHAHHRHVTANASHHHPVGQSLQRTNPVTQLPDKVTQYQSANDVTRPVLVSCTTKHPVVVTAPISTSVMEIGSQKYINGATIRKIPISVTHSSSVTVTQSFPPVIPISPSKRKKLHDQHILPQEVKHFKTAADTHAHKGHTNSDATIIPHETIPGLDIDFSDDYVDDKLEMSDNSDRSMWQCGQCQRSFTQRALLQIHVCQGMPNRPYKCGHCADSFAQPNDLRTHVVKHTNEKSFKCGYCSRSFAGPTTLKNHVRTHTGEKPYICSKCSKMFSTTSQLSRHQRTLSECI